MCVLGLELKSCNMDTVKEFLKQSNWIEREYTERAYKDAVKAWGWIIKQKGDLKVSQILRVHKYLGQNIDPAIAGKFRDCDVWVGGDHKPFISTNILKAQLIEFCKDFNKIVSMKDKEDLEERVRANHVMYERAHVFADINGRSGRILYNLLRVRCGIGIHVICGAPKGQYELHPEQAEYYGWFKEEPKMDDIAFNFLKKVLPER